MAGTDLLPAPSDCGAHARSPARTPLPRRARDHLRSATAVVAVSDYTARRSRGARPARGHARFTHRQDSSSGSRAAGAPSRASRVGPGRSAARQVAQISLMPGRSPSPRADAQRRLDAPCSCRGLLRLEVRALLQPRFLRRLGPGRPPRRPPGVHFLVQRDDVAEVLRASISRCSSWTSSSACYRGAWPWALLRW